MKWNIWCCAIVDAEPNAGTLWLDCSFLDDYSDCEIVVVACVA